MPPVLPALLLSSVGCGTCFVERVESFCDQGSAMWDPDGDGSCTLDEALEHGTWAGRPAANQCTVCACGDGTRVSCRSTFYGQTAYYDASGDLVGATAGQDTNAYCHGAYSAEYGYVPRCEIDGAACVRPLPDMQQLHASCSSVELALSVLTTSPVSQVRILIAAGARPSHIEEHVAPGFTDEVFASVVLTPDTSRQYGVSTAFGCDELDKLSYVLRADDLDGRFTSCRFDGPDGEALVDAIEAGEVPATAAHQITAAACTQVHL